ncbi:response regulator transcription factor [Chloroflexota bacterium]
MKVLIIEDDPEIVEVISLAFQIRWPEVKLVSTNLGEKGVELVESESPDVVILDLGLPDISGYDVLKEIRAFSTVPILILTVRGEETDVVRGLEWGADDYMVKPFRQLELLSLYMTSTHGQVITEF